MESIENLQFFTYFVCDLIKNSIKIRPITENHGNEKIMKNYYIFLAEFRNNENANVLVHLIGGVSNLFLLRSLEKIFIFNQTLNILYSNAQILQ